MSAPALVLVHGAWHSGDCWSVLAAELAKQGIEVHTPDLPGHGNNQQDLADISLKRYAAAIKQFICNLDKPVVLAGHSMGGMVISQLASDLPQAISRLVYLAAYLPCNGESLFDLIEANHATGLTAPVENVMILSEDKRLCSIPEEAIAALFYNYSPKDRVPAGFPDQATLPLAGRVRLQEPAFSNIPKSYICCLGDQVIPIAHQRFMLTRQPCDEMIQLDADHSPFMSCPKALAVILATMTRTAQGNHSAD